MRIELINESSFKDKSGGLMLDDFKYASCRIGDDA